MLVTEQKELELQKGLAPDQAIFLAKQKKKKAAAPKPVQKPKQGKKKK